jgi:MOSC domain-containing protein YiiM
MKMDDQQFVSTFLKSGRSGFYCRVIHEGLIEAGQTIEIVNGSESNLTIAQAVADVNR